MKQVDTSKKDQIQKLRKEIETVDLKYQYLVDQTSMVGEDYYSRAHELYLKNL